MKSQLKIVIIKLLICYVFCVSSQNEKVKIKCEGTVTANSPILGHVLICYTGSDTKILTPNAVVENEAEDDSIEVIVFQPSSDVHFIPQKLKENFPELKAIEFLSQPLKKLSENDLEQFGNDLEWINVWQGKITFLPKNLFRHNRNLKKITFFKNPIKYIEPGFFENIAMMRKLEQIYLWDCNCISQYKIDSDIRYEDWKHSCYDRSVMSKSAVAISNEIRKKEKFLCNTIDEKVCKTSGLKILSPQMKIVSIDDENAAENEKIETFIMNNQEIVFMPISLASTFPNLKELIINNSGLTKLSSGDFKGMTNLRKIEITNNKISSINENVFDGLNSLEVLDLSANEISTLKENIFSSLINLITLNLSDNKITHFYSSFLPFPNKIEEFYINRNKIRYFEKEILNYLWEAKKIEMEENECINEKFDRMRDGILIFLRLIGNVEVNCNKDKM